MMPIPIGDVDDKALVCCLTDALQSAITLHTVHITCNAIAVDVACIASGFYVRISGPDWQMAGAIAEAEARDVIMTRLAN